MKTTRKHAAFTLIELLVVISIIAILVDTLREGHCRTEEQRREYLDLIAAHAGRALSRDPIMATVWGCDRAVTLRSIGRFVNALRNKIEPDPAVPRFIPTVREFGCKFEG